jgi:hypothetical protein
MQARNMHVSGKRNSGHLRLKYSLLVLDSCLNLSAKKISYDGGAKPKAKYGRRVGGDRPDLTYNGDPGDPA